MRDETQPDVRGVGVRVGGHQPAVDGGHDVRILVAQEQVLQLAALEHRGRVAEGLPVRLVAPGVEDHPLAVVDDHVVVRLHRLAEVLLLQHHVTVVALLEKKGDRHGRLLTEPWRCP
jgi:hypothetical protein